MTTPKPKTILITGATDGIGFATAQLLAKEGHTLLIHGRSAERLETAKKALIESSDNKNIGTYLADFSNLNAVKAMAKKIIAKYSQLDVLINNAGVFRIASATANNTIDIRFTVNTLAPYLLTEELLVLMEAKGRVINLSSAAQVPVNLLALNGEQTINDEFEAYAQSKLAITMWSCHLAHTLPTNSPLIVAVNPGSMLGSKMVKEGFGVAGGDINIGADILRRAAITDEFADANGQYFDNDKGIFASPHADATNTEKNRVLVQNINQLLSTIV